MLARTIEVLDQRGIAERFPRTGVHRPGARVRRDPPGPQRLPHPPQLRPRAVAEQDRADPGRLGRGARGPDPPPPRGGGLHPGRHRRRRRGVGRHVAAGGVPRRLRRRTKSGPQDGRHRLPRVGSLDQLDDRRGRDGRGAGGRHAPRGRRHRSRRPGRLRTVPGPVRGATGRRLRRAHAGGSPRGAHRDLRDGLRGAQPDLDLPVHRHEPPGGGLPRGSGAARRRRCPRASPDGRPRPRHGRAGCGEPGMEAGPGGRRDLTRDPAGHLSRRTTSGRRPGAAQHQCAGSARHAPASVTRPSATPWASC